MVLINIDALSDSEIRYIAQQEELSDWDSLSREDLIEELEDLYGDDIHEKEKIDPKYVKTIVSTSSDVLDLPGVSPIPETYSNSYIYFVAVDSDWAYSFWNIAPQKLTELDYQNASMALRVSYENSQVSDSYDIEVNLKDSSWSIELPWEGTYYKVSLIANINENEEVICECPNRLYREKPFFSSHKDILADPDKYNILASSLGSDCSAAEKILSDVRGSNK